MYTLKAAIKQHYNSFEPAAYLLFAIHLPKQLSSSHCHSKMNSAQSVSCVAGIYLGE